MLSNKQFQSFSKNYFLIFILIFLSACTEKQQVIKWNLQSQATKTSIDYKELEKMTANIKTMSNGRLIITPHPGGAITGGPDIFNAVQERRIEMGSGWPNWWSSQHPAWAVMNAGPFDFMNIDASMMFFLSGEGTQMANELSKPEGIIWRPAWWPGMEFGLLSKEPIKKIEDLAQKKVRIGPGLPSEVLTATTGAFSIPLVPSEIRPALENGDLDAVEWTTTSGAWDLGLQNIVGYGIVPAIWQPSVLADFLINEQAYNELPIDLKVILETAIKSYTLTTTMKAKVADFKALKEFKNSNIKLSQWTQEDIQTWREVSDKTLQQYSDKDDFTKRLIESKKSFKQEYNEYYKLFGPYD
ncbi:MAG: TRAP transporter substrate-binding protein DctP [Gammaproteobacteria bacterium]|nr:TRAP transporter substrate-binding protein DctP [Gammaproteobacteria bacterium]